MATAPNFNKAIHLRGKVMPGKELHVKSPQLTEGREVEIYVIDALEPDSPPRKTIAEILEELDTRRIFNSPAEVDSYIQEERNSWDK